MIIKLKYEQIRIDGGTQSRAELLIPVMEDYAEQMRLGVKFPPITVFFDGKDYWLVDGFHRLGAALRVYPDGPIEVEVIQGTQVDAQWYSFGVNKTHGLRRKREDTARAARAALLHPQGVKRSDREIAEHIGVDHKTVARHRAELSASGEIPQMRTRQVNRGDSSYQQDTTCIGKPASTNEKRKRKANTVRISRNAHAPTRGHSEPCPMIPLQFSPNNPRTAAATLWQYFTRSFIETLVTELTQRLSQEGEAV